MLWTVIFFVLGVILGIIGGVMYYDALKGLLEAFKGLFSAIFKKEN